MTNARLWAMMPGQKQTIIHDIFKIHKSNVDPKT